MSDLTRYKRINRKTEMNIAYREIKKSDYRFLKDMLYEALFVPEGEKPYDRSVIDLPEISKYTDNWGMEGDFGIVIIDNEKLIGAIWGRLFNKNNKGYGFVDENTPELAMAIKGEYRNQGLGESLILRFLKFAKDKGYQNLSLSVDKRNRAFNFYKRLGFKIVDEKDSAYTMKIKI